MKDTNHSETIISMQPKSELKQTNNQNINANNSFIDDTFFIRGLFFCFSFFQCFNTNIFKQKSTFEEAVPKKEETVIELEEFDLEKITELDNINAFKNSKLAFSL